MLDIADLKVFFQEPEIQQLIDDTWDKVGDTLHRRRQNYRQSWPWRAVSSLSIAM
ncbi:hypothetical protein E05_33350 [Plautia stali symbiont]|nr:hypothetical protein E05_33350 [Plautia stali symbiont]